MKDVQMVWLKPEKIHVTETASGNYNPGGRSASD